jgi:hypothetical protein
MRPFSRQLLAASLFGFLASLVTADSACAAIVFNPIDDAWIRKNGTQTHEIFNGGDSNRMSQSGGLISNVILEYDLGSLGEIKSIGSATLSVTKSGVMSNIGEPVPIHILGFAGDGVIRASDWDAAAVGVGDFTEMPNADNGTLFSWSLTNLDSLKDQINIGDGLLTLRLETDNFAVFDLAAIENTIHPAPRLAIEVTSVPEVSWIGGILVVAVTMLSVCRERLLVVCSAKR